MAATNPDPTGSLSNAMTIGIVLVACLAARVSVWTGRHDDCHLQMHHFDRECGDLFEFSIGPSIVNDDVFALDISKFGQALPLNASTRAEITEGDRAAKNPIRGTVLTGCERRLSKAQRAWLASAAQRTEC